MNDDDGIPRAKEKKEHSCTISWDCATPSSSPSSSSSSSRFNMKGNFRKVRKGFSSMASSMAYLVGRKKVVKIFKKT
nr:hypothetical protein [Tanacetum cinerariifolium]